MRRIAAAVVLGVIAALGFLLGITTHSYAVTTSTFGRTAVLQAVRGAGDLLLVRQFTPWLLAGVIALGLLGALVACCVTVAVRRGRETVDLVGRSARPAPARFGSPSAPDVR